jgi:predicted ferric reductase
MNKPEFFAKLSVLLLAITVAVGPGLLALWLLPGWLPIFDYAFLQTDPKFYWYASRATAVVGYLLLWLSMLLGLVISSKLSTQSSGKELVYELHKFTSILGLLFAVLHGLLLMGDRYIQFSLFQVLMPFSNQSYKPVWVGIGQLSVYIWLLVWGSFYVRKKISRRVWRLIHFGSFLTFVMVLVHGITSGSDTSSLWTQAIYWTSGSIFLFLLSVRILSALLKPGKIEGSNINSNHIANDYPNQK